MRSGRTFRKSATSFTVHRVDMGLLPGQATACRGESRRHRRVQWCGNPESLGDAPGDRTSVRSAPHLDRTAVARGPDYVVCLPTGPNAVEGVFGSNDLQMVPNIIATVIGKGYVGI